MSKSEIIFINLPPPIPSDKNIGKYVVDIRQEFIKHKADIHYDNYCLNYIFDLICNIYLNNNTTNKYCDDTYDKFSIRIKLIKLNNAIAHLKQYDKILDITDEKNKLYSEMINNNNDKLAIKIFDKINDNLVYMFKGDEFWIFIHNAFTTLFHIYKYTNDTNATNYNISSYTIDNCMEYIIKNENFKDKIQTLKDNINYKINNLEITSNYYLSCYTTRNYAFKKYILDIKDYQYVSYHQYYILDNSTYRKLLEYVLVIIQPQSTEKAISHVYNIYKLHIKAIHGAYTKYYSSISNYSDMYKNIMHNLKLDINKILEYDATLDIDFRAAIKTKLYAIIDSTKPK